MLRATTASLCTYCQRMRAFIPPTSAASTSTSTLPMLIGRLQALMDSEVGAEQIKECPGVLELATQVVLHRVRKLESYGYDVRWGSLDVVVGTDEDFERSCGKLRRLRRQRPLFDAVAPLVSVEE